MKNCELLKQIPAPLVAWYNKNRKPLPWRTDASPYRVWLSEIMLQQTRIEAALPYYHRFLAAAPDIRALAALDDDKLMKLWEGLGYYSRARNLKKCAVLLCERYDCELPREPKELQKLPGIGAYTAGAIASIAYGVPAPAVDGNVLRVVSRITASAADLTSQAVRRAIADALCAVYPTGADAGAFTEGLMELGEVVCIPNGTPLCESCPLADLCSAHAEGRETDYPVHTEKKARRIEARTVFLLRHGERYALLRRPAKGLLAGMLELPNVEGHFDDGATLAWCAEKGLFPVSLKPLGAARHIFSHIEWEMRGVAVECGAMPDGFLWMSAEEIKRDAAIPSAFRAYRAFID